MNMNDPHLVRSTVLLITTTATRFPHLPHIIFVGNHDAMMTRFLNNLHILRRVTPIFLTT